MLFFIFGFLLFYLYIDIVIVSIQRISGFWLAITDRVHLSSLAGQVSTNFPLKPGRSYRFGLQFCAAHICFKPLYTTGVTVIPNPPKTGSIDVLYTGDELKVC